MLTFHKNTSEGVDMEWLVIDIVYLRERGICILVLRASSLKMMAEVSSEVSVQVGDIGVLHRNRRNFRSVFF